MSPIPELINTSPPRRRPSATTLRSPSRNASISRSNSGASNTPNASTTNKKRPHSEEHLNGPHEDPEQTIIHSPRTFTPPPTQSPGKSARGTESQSPHRGSGSGSRRGSASSSLDRTVMPPPPPSGRDSVNGGDSSPEGEMSTSEPPNGSNSVEGNDPIAPTEDEADDESNVSTDDLLVQLPNYDWPGFVSRFSEALKEVGAEKERLAMEHDMWNWMYEIWSSSRDRDDTRRLSREMATVVQWTKLKEADLERAREAHTQSMLAISSVLGIAPKNTTPPPSMVKKKRVQR